MIMALRLAACGAAALLMVLPASNVCAQAPADFYRGKTSEIYINVIVGSANDEVSVCVAWHTSGVRTFDDAKKTQLVVGANGTSEDTYQYPALLNHMFGSRFKMVSGYPGGNDINLAMERGEVQGRCSIPW